jgi:hypothetical protein
MRVKAAVLALAAVLIAGDVSGQTVEVEVGVGYVFGGGSEDPGPSLPAANFAAAVWPSARWGVSVRRVRSIGEDLLDPAVTSGDRTFLGQSHLEYWTVTARRRWSQAPNRSLEIGFGLLLDGRFESLQRLQGEDRVIGSETVFGGFSLEGFVTQPLSRHLAVKGGLTCEGNFETTNLQPIVMASLRW